MDQNVGNPSIKAQIPSDIIRDEVLRLFVVAGVGREKVIEEHISLDSLKLQYPDVSTPNRKLKAIEVFYKITIDEQQVEEIKWYFHYNVRTSQRGYLTYIPLHSYETGMHSLQVKNPEGDSYAIIPFYKEGE